MPNFPPFFLLFTSITCFFSLFVSASFPHSHRQSLYPLNFILGNQNLGPLNDGILGQAQAAAPAFYEPKVPLILAGNRTKRPDILRRFRIYHDGWDISNKHYWASVAFTGVVGFVISLIWLISFGITLLIHHCFGWRISFKGKGSKYSQRIQIMLLLLFSFTSILGCILLLVGQLDLHSEVLHTLHYVVNQSDNTAQMLRNVSDYLSIAKAIDVPQINLPQSTMKEIDDLSLRLSSGAETLTDKTNENSVKVQKVFSTVRSALITVALVMLVLAVVGIVLSILGHQNVIHIFIFSGWILVAITLTLCGTFIIFNSAISDSCVAMKEWVNNPQAETALSNILPCDDERATNETLFESRKVVSMLVNTVNTYIYTAANTDRPPSDQFYYNQSGPLMPPLCYPFDDKMQDRECSSQEVSMTNASVVWARYVCTTSLDNKNCTSPGRLTPEVYGQLALAVNASYAVLHYTPAMLDLQNCNFLRDTFMTITVRFCPPLERSLVIVIVGLVFISAGVILCLVLWLVYANRPQREEAFVKTQSIKSSFPENWDRIVVTSPAIIVPDTGV